MVPRRAAPQPAPGEQLTEILEHVEFPALPEMGDPQDGVLLVVNVYHVDLPAACGSEWEGTGTGRPGTTPRAGRPWRPGSAGPAPFSPHPVPGPPRTLGSGRGGLRQPWKDDQVVGGRMGAWGLRRSARNSMRNSKAKRSWHTGPEGGNCSDKEMALTRKNKFP